MTKKLNLTTLERIRLMQWLQSQKGNLGFIRRAMPVLDTLELSDEEKTEVGWEDIASGGVRWKDTEREFELTFGKSELSLLKPALEAEWPISKAYLAMLEKLELAFA